MSQQGVAGQRCQNDISKGKEGFFKLDTHSKPSIHSESNRSPSLVSVYTICIFSSLINGCFVNFCLQIGFCYRNAVHCFCNTRLVENF